MYYFSSIQETIVEPIKEAFVKMWLDIVGFFPKIIGGIAVFLVGYIVAVFLRKLIATTLTGIKFDDILDKAGVSAILSKVGMKSSASLLLAKVVFYLVILFIVKATANFIEMTDVVDLIDSIIAFLPKAITSALIMLVGFMVADMIQNAVRSTLEAFGLDYAKVLANIIFGFVFVLVLTVALSQLGIETELLNDSVKIILGALGLAAAISLGMGLRSLAKAVVSGVYARDIYKVGTEIEFDGEIAKVAGVGPVTTKLQRLDGGFIMVPNDELVLKSVKGKSSE